jgi:hypothetical protein
MNPQHSGYHTEPALAPDEAEGAARIEAARAEKRGALS